MKLRDNISGRYAKQSKPIEVVCQCGKGFATTNLRVKEGRGKFCSRECSYKYRLMPKTYSKYQIKVTNPGWFKAGEIRPGSLYKTDVNRYKRVHQWINKKQPRFNECTECGAICRTHWANISGNYVYSTDDWVELCPKCHKSYDFKGTKLKCLA